LNGHTGPISSLSFNPSGSLLASGSWDYTVRIWDIFSKKNIVDTLNHNSEVVSIAFHPNEKEIISSTLNGAMHIWEAESGNPIGVIEYKDDL
jgi:periodic tryptophan protein 2